MSDDPAVPRNPSEAEHTTAEGAVPSVAIDWETEPAGVLANVFNVTSMGSFFALTFAQVVPTLERAVHTEKGPVFPARIVAALRIPIENYPSIFAAMVNNWNRFALAQSAEAQRNLPRFELKRIPQHEGE